MPRLSRSGRALMGVGLTRPSVDGRLIPGLLLGGWSGREGSGCWADDATVVLQDTHLGYAHVVAVDVQSGSWRVLAARGANQIAAGDGAWAIWSADLGYEDGFGRRKPDDVSVTEDWYPVDAYGGRVIVQPKYHGPALRFAWDGRKMDLSAAPREPWACGHVDGFGLCVWPHADQAHGIVLSSDGHDFHPDLRMLPSGPVVVSSYGAGEQPHELRRYEIDLATRTFRFTPAPGQPWLEVPFEWADLTRPPVPVPVPPTPTPPTPPAQRPQPPPVTEIPVNKVYALKYRGQFLRSEPGTAGIRLEAAIGEQERVTLTEHADKRMHVTFVASGRILRDGAEHGLSTVETETDGWQTFTGGVTPAGDRFIYRYDLTGMDARVFEVVEVPA